MKKAASVFLCPNVYTSDVEHLIQWMKNPRVTQYLNELPGTADSLERLLWNVPEPMLHYHFNRQGHFYFIRLENKEPIGFVTLHRQSSSNLYEIVYAIGDDTLWGHGFGEAALRAAIQTVFLHWRGRGIVAKIRPMNERSLRLAAACGFQCDATNDHLVYMRLQA